MEPRGFYDENAVIWANASSLVMKSGAFVLATVVRTAGSTPREIGAKMIVVQSGETIGTIGGGNVEMRAIEAAKEMLALREKTRLSDVSLDDAEKQVCGGRMTLFLEAFFPSKEALIFGAGHVAAAVCPELQKIGFAVTVYDDRAERLKLPAFSTARTVCAQYSDLESHVKFHPDLHILVMTPQHIHDFEIAVKVAGREWKFLGILGSKRKKKELINALEEADIPDETIERIRIPVGIEIGSETPEEIAVSIAAELIKLHSKKEH